MTISRNESIASAWIVALSVCFYCLARAFYPAVPAATQWIVIWAALESLAAFYSLSWAFRRSDSVFYACFFGGTLLRLASVGVIAAYLFIHQVPLLVPLLSLVLLYFFFSLLQVPFLTHGLW